MINQRGNGWRAELENLYIGWVHNPLVDLWNGFVDFHNARIERRKSGQFQWWSTLKGKIQRYSEGAPALYYERYLNAHGEETIFYDLQNRVRLVLPHNQDRPANLIIDNQSYPIRENQHSNDLDEAFKKLAENQSRKNRPSKRR